MKRTTHMCELPKYVFLWFFFTGIFVQVSAQTESKLLPEWKPGFLDIHHISTGRGDAAFVIFPDGTTMLIDAGDTSETHPRTLSARNVPLLPDNSKSAPEWIVDYIRQFFPPNLPGQLDYALITHYHDDHFGEIDSTRSLHPDGQYQLTGITSVGSLIPIKTIIDRGYSFPIDMGQPEIQRQINENDNYHLIPTLLNYRKFIEYHSKSGNLKHQTLIPGADEQIVLKHDVKYSSVFKVRNIAANGVIWSGDREESTQLFEEGNYPGENPLSLCIKISYGEFDYFTGGDISGIDANGQMDFNSMESNIAPVVGPVDVAALNHHGNRDSQNPFYVRTLRPRIWIGQTWSSDHPDNNVLRRILSQKIYPGERDLFATAMLQSNREVIGGLTDRYKSQQGHVVIRVNENGQHYQIYILNDSSRSREITAQFGPYTSR